MPPLNTPHVTSRAPATVSGSKAGEPAKALPKAPAAQARPTVPPALTKKAEGSAARTTFAAKAPTTAASTPQATASTKQTAAASTSAAGKKAEAQPAGASTGASSLTKPQQDAAYAATGTYLKNGTRPDAETLGHIHQEATRLTKQAFDTQTYKPLTAKEAILVSTDELLQMPDETKAANSRTEVNSFRAGVKNRMDAATNPLLQTRYSVKLEPNMVGETAHVHAANVLTNGEVKAVMQNPKQEKMGKVGQFMPNDTIKGESSGTDLPKSKLNHTIVAPYTATLPGKDAASPTAAHEKIRKSFMSGIEPERKTELDQNVDAQMQAAGNSPPGRPRVGIWVRGASGENGHTSTQNMTPERFRQILDATHQAYPDGADIMLLGDGIPKKDQQKWFAGTPWADNVNTSKKDPKKANASQAADLEKQPKVIDFSKPWDSSSEASKAKAGSAPAGKGGYGEQVAIYDRLYREHNMQAIVTNKSGGPDLPSLAGVPQIALSDVNKGDVMANHRLYIQSLVSHSHTVVPVSLENKQAGQPLGQDEQKHLTSMLQRAPVVRNADIAERNRLDALEADPAASAE